jgi:hypothetical protein
MRTFEEKFDFNEIEYVYFKDMILYIVYWYKCKIYYLETKTEI